MDREGREGGREGGKRQNNIIKELKRMMQSVYIICAYLQVHVDVNSNLI